MTRQLTTLLHGRPVGTVSEEDGQLSFAYRDDWRSDPGAFPLSLSMPLSIAEHPHTRIDAFLWGLLPDNDRILAEWARRFRVSTQSVFDLIAHVGQDCAGAVQFIHPERLPALLASPRPPALTDLSEADLALRLRTLRADPAAWRLPGDPGQFTLSGVLPKIALYRAASGWAVPSGLTPTTHILKPPAAGWAGHSENEHFCLTLARAAGLDVPASSVLHAAGEVAIVLDRYDRALQPAHDGRPAEWLRIHQEDACQAIGLHPAGRYEINGGPGIVRIAELIRQHCSDPEPDLLRFIDAIIFNWLIGGIERHAKNYSFLLGPGSHVRLAPLYDPASVLHDRSVDPRGVKLAMQIGGEFSLRYIGMRNWQKLAAEIQIDEESLIDRIREMADSLFDHALSVEHDLQSQGSAHPTLPGLAGGLKARAAACRRLMQ